MRFSSAHKTLLTDVIGWFMFAGALFYVGTHFNELRHKIDALSELQAAGGTDAGAATGAQEVTQRSGDSVELRANGGGHFDADIEINGRRMDALVDTGATIVMLTNEDAARAGIYPRAADFTIVTETANGRARAAPVMLDRVSIGNIVVHNVRAAVAERGRLNTNLLGMSFLRRLRTFEIRSGRLVLQD